MFSNNETETYRGESGHENLQKYTSCFTLELVLSNQCLAVPSNRNEVAIIFTCSLLMAMPSFVDNNNYWSGHSLTGLTTSATPPVPAPLQCVLLHIHKNKGRARSRCFHCWQARLMTCKLAFYPNSSNADSERGLERSALTCIAIKQARSKQISGGPAMKWVWLIGGI